jgi:hypothetical protein
LVYNGPAAFKSTLKMPLHLHWVQIAMASKACNRIEDGVLFLIY